MSAHLVNGALLAPPPLAANTDDSVEAVSQVMLVPVVADGAEVVVSALGTLPPDNIA